MLVPIPGLVLKAALGENVCRVRESLFNTVTLVMAKIKCVLFEIVMYGTVSFRSWISVSVAGSYGCHVASSKLL